MDSTRCWKHFSERVGPCWLHSDAFILLSTHATSSQRCSVWLRYDECTSYGRKTEVTVSFSNLAMMCACQVASYLPACSHLNSERWPWRPHPDTDTMYVTSCTPGFLRSRFIFPPLSHAILVRTYIASFSCSLLTGVESGIALCCSSPSNSRLNDVCFLKYPSSHCCCTELSFICGLLTWASFAIVLWLLSWVTEVPILRIASDILRSQSA